MMGGLWKTDGRVDNDMDQSNNPRSGKIRLCAIKGLRILLFYVAVPVVLLTVLAQLIRDTVLRSEPAVYWILLVALGAVALNWLVYALIRRKRPTLLVFAHGILCLLIVVLIEQFSFPGYYSVVSTLAVIGGFLALAFLFLISFWLAATHNKAAHSAAVVIWVILFLTLCLMGYQVARDIESRIVDRDTWITIGSIAAMVLAAFSPLILSSCRRAAARRRKTGLTEGRIVQIIGETRLDRYDEMVTRYHARIQYTVREISYETRADISKFLTRLHGRKAFIGREVPVSYDPENPAEAFVSRITRKLLADRAEADPAPEAGSGGGNETGSPVKDHPEK